MSLKKFDNILYRGVNEVDNIIENAIYNLAFSETEVVDNEVLKVFGEKYNANDLIVREGDTDGRLFLIVDGSVSIVKNYQEEEENKVAELYKGELFGEMSYFDRMPRSATVLAKTDCVMIVLDNEQYDILFQIHPKWTTRVVEALASRICNGYSVLNTKLDENVEPRFLKYGERVSFNRSDIIFQDNDEYIYYIISGNVSIMQIDKKQIVDRKFIGRGRCFGTTSAFSDSTAEKAIALSNVSLYRWNKDAFIMAVGIYQELARDVINSMSGLLRDVNNQISI